MSEEAAKNAHTCTLRTAGTCGFCEAVAAGEPDAYLDADGRPWLNLRKWPEAWPGAYDFEPSCTPVYLTTPPESRAT